MAEMSWCNRVQTRGSKLQQDLVKAVNRAVRAASPNRDKSYVPESEKHASRPATVTDRKLQALLSLALILPFVMASRGAQRIESRTALCV